MKSIRGSGEGRATLGGTARAAALVVAVAILGAAPVYPAAAQERPPAGKAPSIDDEVDQIRRLVGGGFWKPAKLAITRFFEAHQGDRRVSAHLPEIEADLRRVDARIALPPMKPLELLGRGAVKYDAASGKAEFVVPRFAEDRGWRSVGGMHLFDALFTDEVEIVVEDTFTMVSTIFLGFDPEKGGGYAFLTTNGEYGRYPTALRTDKDEEEPEKLGTCSVVFGRDATFVTYGYTATHVTIAVDRGKGWNPADRHSSARFPDKTYRRGYVAVKADAAPRTPITIRGKLDVTFAKR